MALSMRTLVFSDIEGSTSLLDRAGAKYRDMLAVHRRIIRAAVEEAGGTEHSTEGDSFFLSFDSPTAAIAAAEHTLGFRERARDLIEADGAHAAAQARGARMSPEDLVTNAIAFCAAG